MDFFVPSGGITCLLVIRKTCPLPFPISMKTKKPVPDEEFPHLNKTDYDVPSEMSGNISFKKFRQQLKSNIKIRYIDWRGLW